MYFCTVANTENLTLARSDNLLGRDHNAWRFVNLRPLQRMRYY